ncbi:MAG TPA: tetratricopeptide repeat protein [Thermoanaerobaculia bacterium]|nr:tetratricopeptide repeat protein [Thermoanaerobaculia bacterium]
MSTFRQALELYKSNNLADTIAGCEFVLKMDPLFDPAKKLLNKSKNPSASLDLDSLLPPDPTLGDLEEARNALRQRNFQRAADIATTILGSDMTNQEAQRIAGEAQEKIEAEPFAQQFLEKCRASIENGNLQAARAALEKVRSLDAGHPEIERHEEAIRGAEGGSGPAAPQGASASPAVPDHRDSFVLDAPAPGRSQSVHDFGFTFEEEASAGTDSSFFSFDAPEQPPAGAPIVGAPIVGAPIVGEAQTFDFTTASVDVSPEDQAKIRQYLEEGDRAFQSADYQKAIDVWSRIFLIDVTNDEASERIDRAKRKRLDIEGDIEAVLLAGTEAFEKKNFPEARARFEEALRLDPSNFSARDYLSKLDTAAAPAVSFDEPKLRPPALDLDEDYEPSRRSIEVPAPVPIPEPARSKAPSPPSQKPRRSLPPLKVPAMIVGALLILGGAYLVWARIAEREREAAAQNQATIAEAQSLARRGDFDGAIERLVALQPDDPEHDKALELIAEYKRKKAEAAGMIGGRPATEVFAELLQKATAAFEARDYLAANQAFDEAAGIRAIPPELKSQHAEASQQVTRLNSAMLLFGEGKYDEAIELLEQLRSQDPTNRNVVQLLANAHFNLGVAAMRENRDDQAVRHFDETLELAPDDEMARRSKDLVLRYQGEGKDLLYRIYVKYLPLR